MLGLEVVGPHASADTLGRLTDFQRFPDLFGWIANGAVIEYLPAFREFSIPHANGGSTYVMDYCPLTGVKLPESLRDRWFDSLEAEGLLLADELMPPEFIPPEAYRSDAWWRDTIPAA